MALKFKIEENNLNLKVCSGDNLSFGVKEGIPIMPPIYDGELIIIPKAEDAQILECANKMMPQDVTVQKIPYYETHNTTGMTVYIASEV